MNLLKIQRSPLQLASILLPLFACITVGCAAQSPRRVLLALSKTDHVLNIIDPSTFTVRARIPVGSDPHEVIASADGKMAFVTIYGGGSLHELDVIDLVAQKPLRVVDTKPLFGPHGITFVNDKAWFTAEGSKAVGRFDPATGQLDWSMGTGQDRTHMIYVTDNAKTIYTTNVASGTVSILADTLFTPFPGARPHEDWSQTIIPTARGSEGFDISPDGSELWTASSESGAISIINLRTRQLAASLDAKAMGANRVKFTPDGRHVFISSLQSELTIVDASTRREVKRMNLGRGASGILMDNANARAFVACTGDNVIVIIDLKTLEVIRRLDLVKGPDGLAWAIQR